MWFFLYRMNNKNIETDVGVQPEGQKSKTANPWLLPLSQSKMVILPPGILEWDCVWELSPPILYSSLGLGLKVYTTTALFQWQTSVAIGIKGVYHHCLVCKADQGGCFTLWSSGKLYLLNYLFIKIQMRYHCTLTQDSDTKTHKDSTKKRELHISLTHEHGCKNTQ